MYGVSGGFEMIKEEDKTERGTLNFEPRSEDDL